MSKRRVNPCCCITSATGRFLIGVLQAVVGGIGVLLSFRGFNRLGEIQTLVHDQFLGDSVSQDLKQDSPGYDDVDDIIHGLQVRLGYFLFMSIDNLLCATLLIHGIVKTYLVLNGILFVISVIATIIITVIVNSSVFAVYCVLIHIVSFYLLVVVYAAYLETRYTLESKHDLPVSFNNPLANY